MKKTVSLIICLVFIFITVIPVNAAANDVLEIKFQIGSSKLWINGKVQIIEKPFIANKNIFIPLQVVLEAYGAEVNVGSKGKISLVYRETAVDMTVGNKRYTANDTAKEFPAMPVYKGKTVMVPVKFITDNFGGTITYEKGKDTYKLILADDGAISDFSSVLGSIAKPKLGNSYFGWYISIPKGSQIVGKSFSSKDVSVENQQKKININISVSIDEGKSLEDIVNDIKEEKIEFDHGYSVKVIDTSINSKANPSYAEVLASNYQKGAMIIRVYISNSYVYKLTVSTSNETNPQKLKEKATLMEVVNSFKLGYKGAAKDVYDISKVRDGVVKYTDSVYGFSMDVFPEWDIIKDQYTYNPFNVYYVKVGAGNGEYLSIIPVSNGDGVDMDKHIDKIIEENALYCSSKFYSFIGKETIELQPGKLYKMVYSLQLGSKKYIIEDSYVVEGSILYNITLKCPDGKYNSYKDRYKGIYQSIKYTPRYSDDELKKIIGTNENLKISSRVGKEDGPVDYEDKDFRWKARIPGYWMKLAEYGEGYTTFYIDKYQSYISVESIKKSSINKNLEDENKFEAIASVADDKENARLLEKKKTYEKGKEVTLYVYRYENNEDEMFTDMYFYVVDGTDYSYCFNYVIPDIYASDKNLKEVRDIWDSFSVQ